MNKETLLKSVSFTADGMVIVVLSLFDGIVGRKPVRKNQIIRFNSAQDAVEVLEEIKKKVQSERR